MEFKVRDLREKFFLVDDAYLNGYAKLCGINATGVYIALCRHVGKEQSCFPSKRTIAEKLSISERSVYSAIKDLEKWNIIRVESQGRKEDGSYRSLTYYLVDKSQWKPKPSAIPADGIKQVTPAANGWQKVPKKDSNLKDTHIRKREEIEKLRNTLIHKNIINVVPQ
ncbi:MAG: helix-turn-helix domain-containing protein [Nitrospiraceae bacterium]|nr:MAG: helix-turn-helix domain-containing protein [Nitrospiraceae bacterium]